MNNFKLNASSIPEFQLRWLVQEKQEEWYGSWNTSNEKQYRMIHSKPVLQFSNNGVEWIDVPLVIISDKT